MDIRLRKLGLQMVSNRSYNTKSTGQSLTIPDQALTPQELLRNFVRGEAIGFSNNFIFDDDIGINLPEFNKMDTLDKLHFAQENKAYISDLRDTFNDFIQLHRNELNKATIEQNDEQNDDTKNVASKEAND